ncbi:MAG: hypothetical protein D3906_14235, partial [Candidatus Electrothrix sp. AUS1_2]|nr:hypothetical protein [Candidatus Electrothrix sp. AUS1_2]
DAVKIQQADPGILPDIISSRLRDNPQFPERRKSALVKKELQILQLLAEQDAAPERLLAAALKVAGRRVVVKRPLKAPCLTALLPSHSLFGKTVRFDVYLGGAYSLSL